MPHWVLFFIYVILAIYATVECVKPYLAERHYRDGFNFSAMERTKYGIEELEDAVRLAPWETYYQAELGKMYEKYATEIKDKETQIHLYKKARQLYLYSIYLENKNPWYKNRLASVYFELSNLIPEKKDDYFSRAQRLNLEAAEVDPNNPLFQLNYAYFLHRSGNIKEAVPYYLRTIEIDDRIVEARFNLADILRQEGKVQETLDQYLKIWEKNPSFNRVNLAIASIYIAEKQEEKSIPYLQRELQLNPGQEDVMANLNAFYVKYNRWTDAVPLYREMFDKYPKYREAYHQFYIQALVNTGQIPQAIDSLNEFLKLYPNNTTARYQLSRLERATRRP